MCERCPRHPIASQVPPIPLGSPRWALCAATSEEEQAVSMPLQGPCRPKVYATRPLWYGAPLPAAGGPGEGGGVVKALAGRKMLLLLLPPPLLVLVPPLLPLLLVADLS